MTLSPIALFTYNRAWHTKQTVEALSKNIYATESDLFIFSDGPKNNIDEPQVIKLRKYLKTIAGFKSVTIINRDKNLGLAGSIIAGVTEIVNEYGKIIVLEDDLLTSPYFLKFMNDGLNKFENKDEVASINGYCLPISGLPDIFFLKFADCLGWATWKRAWNVFQNNAAKLLVEIKNKKLNRAFNFNYTYPYLQMLKAQTTGLPTSWAVLWYASVFIHNKISLFSGKSLVYHNGVGSEATNVTANGSTDWLKTPIYNQPINLVNISLLENLPARKKIETFFKSAYSDIWYKSFIYKLYTYNYIPNSVMKIFTK